MSKYINGEVMLHKDVEFDELHVDEFIGKLKKLMEAFSVTEINVKLEEEAEADSTGDPGDFN